MAAPSRRQLLATASTAVAAGLAGCGSVTDYEFSATPVVLGERTRAALGYVTLRQEPVVTERSRTVGGVDVDATVESHVAVYGTPAATERATPAAPTVGAVSTPDATVLGRSFNPLARRPLASLTTGEAGTELLAWAGLDEIGGGTVRWEREPTFVSARVGECLDTATTLETYAGVLGGAPHRVAFVHLTRIRADSVVIATAVHGHEVGRTDRPLVGSDDSTLSESAVGDAVDTFATATAALTYGGGT